MYQVLGTALLAAIGVAGALLALLSQELDHRKPLKYGIIAFCGVLALCAFYFMIREPGTPPPALTETTIETAPQTLMTITPTTMPALTPSQMVTLASVPVLSSTQLVSMPTAEAVGATATATPILTLASATAWFVTPNPVNDDQGMCVPVLTAMPEPNRPRAYKIGCRCSGAGWCGVVIPLNKYDASGNTTLSIWAKGEHGGEQVEIGVKDTQTPAGQELKTTQTLTTTWSPISVLLQDYKRQGHDFSSLDNFNLILKFPSDGGSEAFYVDSFIFGTY